jgi:hypothetical protein
VVGFDETAASVHPILVLGARQVRNYFTTWLWYEDRVSTLSSSFLIAISCLCLATLAASGIGLVRFLDDLAFLVAENDVRTGLVLVHFLLVASAAFWVLSCALVALTRKWLLYWRGL